MATPLIEMSTIRTVPPRGSPTSNRLRPRESPTQAMLHAFLAPGGGSHRSVKSRPSGRSTCGGSNGQRIHIPELDRPVVACGGQRSPIRGECHLRDGAPVTFERDQQSARSHVPDPHVPGGVHGPGMGRVSPSSGEEAAVGREREVVNLVGMRCHGDSRLTRDRIGEREARETPVSLLRDESGNELSVRTQPRIPVEPVGLLRFWDDGPSRARADIP